VVPDVGEDEQVRDLEMTRDSNVGSYLGVPLQFSDGRLFGTVCCMSHSPHPELREHDARFMGIIARLIAEHTEREELAAKNRELEIKATGIGTLLAAIEARDGYTGNHSQAVVELSMVLARRMGFRRKRSPPSSKPHSCTTSGRLGCPTRSCTSRDRWMRVRRS
jgi:response regulator RpfG family c-di-GMP phosphodiesterase